MEECARSGLHIECHTVTHPDLRELPPERIAAECVTPMPLLSSTQGAARTLLAFPFGLYDMSVV